MATTRLAVASVALALVATLGSTGCCRQHRYRVVYAYRVPVTAAAPAPVYGYAPPPPMAPPPAYPVAYPGAGQPVIIRTQSTTIVVNPPRPGPTTIQVLPAHGARPVVVPQVQPAQPAPSVPQGQQDPAWFDNE